MTLRVTARSWAGLMTDGAARATTARSERGAGVAGRGRRLGERVRQAVRGDRGSVSAELVIATPLLLLILLAIVQFALWSHATHIAQAAAAQGLAATRTLTGTTAAGTTSARELLDQLGAGPLRDATVEVDRTAVTATVTIRGSASPVLPGVALPVHAEATGPVERFVPDLAAQAGG